MKKMKCAAEDYTEADFPATRKEVFSECYREHFSLIFRLGLVCFLALIPVLITMLLRDIYIIGVVEGLAEKTDEKIAAVYYQADAVFGLFQIGANALFAALFAGVIQILRQLLWNEPVFFGDDFKKGIKSNSLRYFAVAFLLSLTNYALNMLSGSLVTYILSGVFIVMILPVSAWFSLQGIYYKSGVLESIKNAVLFYIKTLPVTILLLVCTTVPFLLANSITLILAKCAVIIVLALLYIVPLAMCWMLYATHVFDKFVNKENYPEIYRKGMRKEI